MSIDKPKRVSQKYQPHLNQKQLQQKVKQLSFRLSRQNIVNETNLIKHMNPKLQIKFKYLKKDSLFLNVKTDDILKILSKVQFLKQIGFQHKTFSQKKQQKNNKKQDQNKQENIQKQLIFKILYPDMDRTILSTGINKNFIKEALNQYNYQKSQTPYFGGVKKSSKTCSMNGFNDYWIAIEAISSCQAYNFKKFIRNKKRSMDMQLDYSYKEDKKRVRIIMLNEDFYTLLVDATSQKKSQIFAKKLLFMNQYNTILYANQPKVESNYKGKINQVKQSEMQINYFRMQIFYIPIQTSQQNFNSNRQQYKDEDTHLNSYLLNSNIQDFISEDLSKNSEALDYRKLEDLIETSQQGIQAQNCTQQINSEAELSQKISCAKIFSNQLELGEQLNRVSVNNQQNSCQNYKSKYQNLHEDLSSFQKNQNNNSMSRYSQNQRQNMSVDQLIVAQQINQKQNEQNLIKMNQENFVSHSIFLQLKQISTQTMFKFSQLKRYQKQFMNKTKNKHIMAPGVPQQFKQISDQMKYKGLFFQRISKRMFKLGQPKKMEWEQ